MTLKKTRRCQTVGQTWATSLKKVRSIRRVQAVLLALKTLRVLVRTVVVHVASNVVSLYWLRVISLVTSTSLTFRLSRCLVRA